MGSLGSADFKELKEFQKKLQQLEDDRAEFCERCSKALAGRLLAMVIKRTPVGKKPKFDDLFEGEKTVKLKVTGSRTVTRKAYNGTVTYQRKTTQTREFLTAKGAQYEKYWDGYIGGILRRNWTGGKSTGATTYANSLPVYKNGDNYTIVVENPTEYASYVEFGHRQTPGKYVPAIGKRLKASWVNGKYMLTLSEKDLESMAPAILEKELNKFFAEVFDE